MIARNSGSKGFQCITCGKWHDELPLDVGFAEPYYIDILKPDEREKLVESHGDFRTYRDDEKLNYFIRGILEIPVRDLDDAFCYGSWISLSEKSYVAARAAYQSNSAAGPFMGWFSNRIAGYPETLGLAAKIEVNPNVRGKITLQPTDHPLAVEQLRGITIDRVIEIVDPLMHPK